MMKWSAVPDPTNWDVDAIELPSDVVSLTPTADGVSVLMANGQTAFLPMGTLDRQPN